MLAVFTSPSPNSARQGVHEAWVTLQENEQCKGNKLNNA